MSDIFPYMSARRPRAGRLGMVLNGGWMKIELKDRARNWARRDATRDTLTLTLPQMRLRAALYVC